MLKTMNQGVEAVIQMHPPPSTANNFSKLIQWLLLILSNILPYFIRHESTLYTKFIINTFMRFMGSLTYYVVGL